MIFYLKWQGEARICSLVNGKYDYNNDDYDTLLQMVTGLYINFPYDLPQTYVCTSKQKKKNNRYINKKKE